MKRVYGPLIGLCVVVILAAVIFAGWTEYKDFALWKAAKRDQTEKVKRLLADGADVNAKDRDGVTALMSTLRTKPAGRR